MYSFLNTKLKVKQYKVFNTELYSLYTDGILRRNDLELLSVYGLESNNYGIFAYSNMQDVKTSIIYENKVMIFDFSLESNSFNGQNCLVYNKNYNDQIHQIGLFEVSNNQVSWFDNIPRFGENLRINDYIIFKASQVVISLLDIITLKIKWETPLNRNGEIFKILGVRENELIVCWKRGMDYYGLLGIDIQTGKIVWNMDDNSLLNGLNLYFTENQKSIFSTKGDDKNSYFIEIDLENKELQRYGEIPDLCKAKLVIHSSQYKDGLIYFTASTRHVFFPDVIGVFDYKTLKVLWQHRFTFDRLTHLKNFEVSDDTLYVLDSGDTLHIFERETM